LQIPVYSDDFVNNVEKGCTSLIHSSNPGTNGREAVPQARRPPAFPVVELSSWPPAHHSVRLSYIVLVAFEVPNFVLWVSYMQESTESPKEKEGNKAPEIPLIK